MFNRHNTANDNNENTFDWVHCGLIMSAFSIEGACAGGMFALIYCGDLIKQGLMTASQADTYGLVGLFGGAALGAFAGYEISKYAQAAQQEERTRLRF